MTPTEWFYEYVAERPDGEIGGDEDYNTHEIALRAYEALTAAGYRIVRP